MVGSLADRSFNTALFFFLAEAFEKRVSATRKFQRPSLLTVVTLASPAGAAVFL